MFTPVIEKETSHITSHKTNSKQIFLLKTERCNKTGLSGEKLIYLSLVLGSESLLVPTANKRIFNSDHQKHKNKIESQKMPPL